MDETFASDEKLYRGLHAIWIEEDDSVSSAAFKDSGGVSVDRDGGRDEQNCRGRMVEALYCRRRVIIYGERCRFSHSIQSE